LALGRDARRRVARAAAPDRLERALVVGDRVVVAIRPRRARAGLERGLERAVVVAGLEEVPREPLDRVVAARSGLALGGLGRGGRGAPVHRGALDLAEPAQRRALDVRVRDAVRRATPLLAVLGRALERELPPDQLVERVERALAPEPRGRRDELEM